MTSKEMPMKLIVLEGIDGSGKSTIYDQLKNEFEHNSKVKFLKSPPEPFSGIMPEFWDTGNLFDRFLFFITSNNYFSKQMKKMDDCVFVLDRFTYSTYITHYIGISKEQRELLLKIVSFADIVKAYKIFLIQASMDTIISRLDERNNSIDNKLKGNQEYFQKLYDAYYTNMFGHFGEIETLPNEHENDLVRNIETIKKYILKLQML